MPTPPKKLTIAEAQDAVRKAFGGAGNVYPRRGPAEPQGPDPASLIHFNPAEIERLRTLKVNEDTLSPTQQEELSTLENVPTAQKFLQTLMGGEEARRRLQNGMKITAGNLWEAVKDPTIIGRGVEAGVAGLVKGGATTVGHISQALAPEDLNTGMRALGLPEAFPRKERNPFVNLAKSVPFLGEMIDPTIDGFNARIAAELPGDKHPTAVASAAFKGIVGTAKEVVKALLEVPVTGQIADPTAETGYRQATPEETIRALFDVGMLIEGAGALKRRYAPELPTVQELLVGKPTTPRPSANFTQGETEAFNHMRASEQEITAILKGKADPLAAAPIGASGESVILDAKQRIKSGGEYPVLGDAQAKVKLLSEAWQRKLSVDATLDNPAYAGIVGDVIADPLRLKVMTDLIKQGDIPQTALAKVLNDPVLTKVAIPEALLDGATPDMIREAIAAATERTSHLGGQDLQVLSDVQRTLAQELSVKATTGTFLERVGAQEHLQALADYYKAAKDLREGGAHKAANFLTEAGQFTSRVKIGYMLSGLPTAITVFGGQAATGVMGLFDALNSGLLASGGQVLRGKVPSFRENFVDLSANFVKGLQFIKDPRQLAVVTTLDALPATKGNVMVDLVAQSHARLGWLSGNIIKGMSEMAQGKLSGSEFWQGLRKSGTFDPSKPAQIAGDMIMLPADMATIPLRAQEEVMRKWYFGNYLRAGLEKIGVSEEAAMAQFQRASLSSPDGAKNLVGTLLPDGTYDWGSPSAKMMVDLIDPTLRKVVLDAQQHALGSTWAATPDGGLMGSMLTAVRNFNAVSPIQSDVLITPFVRAMANGVMWQLEHSPTQLAQLLSPAYRDRFLGVGSHMRPVEILQERLAALPEGSPLAKTLTSELKAAEKKALYESLQTQRAIGKAMTGAMMVVGATYMAQGGQVMGYRMGSKPWIWTTGEKGDDGNPYREWDVRKIPQLYTASVMAALAVESLGGQRFNMGPVDVMNGLLNSRVSEQPIFNIQESLQNMTSTGEFDPKLFTELAAAQITPFGNIAKSWMAEGVRDVAEAVGVPKGTGLLDLERSGPLHELKSLLTGGGVELQPAPALEGNDLLNPLIGKVNPGALPNKYDPFTGDVAYKKATLQEYFFDQKATTPMEYLLSSTPGYRPAQIAKRYPNPEAQELVNKHTGMLLQGKELSNGMQPLRGPEGETLQEYARKLNYYGDPYLATAFIESMLPGIHELAEVSANIEDAKLAGLGAQIGPHFVEVIAKEDPTLGVPEMRKLWEELARTAAGLPALPSPRGSTPQQIPQPPPPGVPVQ